MTTLGRFIERTGFGDGTGNVSFNKMVTAASLVIFGYAVGKALTPSWSLLTFGTVIIGAGFGLKGYMAALKQQQTMATVNDSMTITGDLAQMVKEARARRDFDKGIDEGPEVETL